MSRRGVVLFLALSVMWGLPYLMIRVAVLHGVDPGTLVFLRTAPAACILVPLAWRAGALRPVLLRWRWLVVYAFVHFGVPWLLMSSAEQHLTSSVTGMLVATVPLLAAVVALRTHPEERFGPARVAGLGLGALGVGLLVGFDVAGSTWVWIAAMGVVVVGYAIGPVLISLHLDGLQGVGIVACAVTVVALAYTPYGVTHLPSHVSWSVVGAIAVLAIVCTAGAFLVMVELIGEVGPSRMVVVTYLNTAVAVLLGVAVLGESLTKGIILGFPLIIAGSVLATRRAPAVSAASLEAASPPRRSWRRAPRPTLPR
ncbi:MAG TPA: DMT family transporter [Acidimicrobiales bacterium]|jgi:drug/metabolite transporter (DMT)-like permease|nr:DMT family transporter [Acidimicrobiales bacterium]